MIVSVEITVERRSVIAGQTGAFHSIDIREFRLPPLIVDMKMSSNGEVRPNLD